MDDQTFLAMLLTFGIISLVFLILMFIGYLLNSFCFKKMFKAYGYQHPNYAFIPFYRDYILADLTVTGDVQILGLNIQKKYFVWWWLLCLILSFFRYAQILSVLILIYCLGYCLDVAFKKLDPNHNSKALAYICAAFNIVMWFVVLPKKNR